MIQANINNRWAQLSQNEKAELLGIYTRAGYNDLASIVAHYNEFSSGGGIHIKPENRGKFTALKERTGHSASWFKEHGTPTQKKMAVFALNARKWKHEDGGLLNNFFEDGGPEKTYQEQPVLINVDNSIFQPLQPLRDPIDNDKYVFTFGNWLNNRRDILAKNMKETGMDSGERRYFALPFYNTIGLSPEEKAVNEELESQLARVEGAGYTEKLLPLFTHGQYNTKKNEVELSTVLGKEGNPKDVVSLHEFGHALGQGSPQEEVIRRHFANKKNKDKYLDDPSEIYTRLMTFRKLHNIDPNKTYTLDDIKALRNEAKKDLDDVITKPWTEHDRLQDEYAKKLADYLYPKLRDKVKDTWWWKRNGGGEGFYRSLKSDFLYARDLANQYGVEIPSEIQEIFNRSIKLINNDNSLQKVRYGEDNDFFKRMSDEDMLFLLNEVANAGNQESLYENYIGNVSANGGPLAITSQYIRTPKIETMGTPNIELPMPETKIETPMSFDLAPELYNMVPLMYDIPTVTVPFSPSIDEQKFDPVRDAARRIRSVENSKDNPNGGWNEKEQRWYPHKSHEGGADTIAYGIKLSNGTPEAELALQQGYLTDEQAVHFTDSLAQTYYNAAKKVYDEKYGAGEWDKLSPESQSFLTDFSYNPGLGKFPKLMEGFHSGNIDMIRQNYKRYSNGKPLGRNKTLLEELERFGNEVSIFRKCGGKIKKDGGKLQQYADFSGFF